MDSLIVKDGRLLMPAENVQIPVVQVVSAEFTFDGFSTAQCRELLERSDTDTVIRKLTDAKDSLLTAVAFKGNAPEWLRLLSQAQFHNGDYAAATATMQTLRQTGDLSAEESAPYEILSLIEGNRIAEAAKLFDAAKMPDKAAAELILARLSASRSDYKDALQHLARLQIFYYREKEWMPCALFYEGLVSKQVGLPAASAAAVQELETLYPASRWCRMAKEQLK
jgi:tetratricopeptide (TPR) repeat protein